jgi:hypothetical protein
MDPISIRTARNWLTRLGFDYGLQFHKGFYEDGHDREDVEEFRQKTFLPLFIAYRCLAPIWFKELDSKRFICVDSLSDEEREKLSVPLGPRPLTPTEKKLVDTLPAPTLAIIEDAFARVRFIFFISSSVPLRLCCIFCFRD